MLNPLCEELTLICCALCGRDVCCCCTPGGACTCAPLVPDPFRSQVALACHLRVASPRASLGVPEVLIGLLPGAGGTQRLPRLVKAEMALGMITTGKMVSVVLDLQYPTCDV